MTSFLEVIAADHSNQVVAGRKAVALATKRVNERYARFLLAAEDRANLDARLQYVEDDLRGVVQATCEEVGYENEKLADQIIASYRGQEKYQPQQRTASMTFEARRPKMCPYHKEVVDIALSSGDPKAGYEAMASHAWGANHCDGEFEGNCNFRREMVTQDWWDQRDKALQERREERERQRDEEAQLQVEQEAQELEVQEPESAPEAPSAESDPDLGVDTESPSEGLTEAPEGVDGVEAEVPMAMAASFQRLAPGKHHLPGASDKQNSQYEAIKRECLKDGGSEDECKQKAARIVNSQRGSNQHEAEAVKTIDVEQRKGPSPKMDKRKWTVENLEQRVQTEGDGSPHPTRAKDVTRPIAVENNDGLHPQTLTEVGEDTTEKQDVSKDTHPTPTNRRTWPTGEISAVSASLPDDVEKNPIQEILESDFDGFVPQAVVQAYRAD